MATISGGAKLDRALSEIARRIKTTPTTLQVGFLSGATYPDGTSVAMVAALQNFGAPAVGIPPRPFFTNMVKEKSPTWAAGLEGALKAADYDVDKALGMVGEGIKGQLQQSIIDTNEPPNSPVTNLLKARFPMGGQTFDDVLKARADVAAGVSAGAGKPLVQSSQMLNSVGWSISR